MSKNFLVITLKNIFLFLFLLISIFFISCGGLFFGFITFGIGLLISIPGAIWIIYKILKNFFGKKYMWRFLFEIIILSIITGFMLFYLPYLENTNELLILVIIVVAMLLIGSYRFYIYRNLFLQKSDFPVQSIETIDLMDSLKKADISNISSIEFIPKNGKSFRLENENIKRIGVYITTTLNKSEFVPEELRGAFEYINKYITPGVTQDEFESIKNKIEEFVQSGGEVKIEKYNP